MTASKNRPIIYGTHSATLEILQRNYHKCHVACRMNDGQLLVPSNKKARL